MPLSIFGGLILFAFLIGSMMRWYSNHIEAGLMRLVSP